MTYNNTLCSNWLRMIIKFELSFITLVSATSHNELHLVRIAKLLPYKIWIYIFIFMIEWLSRSTWEIFYCFIRLTPDYVFITSVGLGISFLQQKDPKLLISSSSSTENYCFTIWFYWYISIKLYQFPFTIKAKPNQKVSILDVVILKQSLNKPIVFCQSSQRAQKVTISQLSLYNIIGLYSFLE